MLGSKVYDYKVATSSLDLKQPISQTKDCMGILTNAQNLLWFCNILTWSGLL